jgi:hypothetical protein
MRLFPTLLLSLLVACGDGESPASAVMNAASDAVGCSDLDQLATAVEAWSATFDTFDPMKPDEALLKKMTDQGAEVQRLSMAIATNPIVRTPACAPRWNDVSQRMQTVSTRMEERMAKIGGQAEAMSGCIEKCGSEQDPAKMMSCMQACQGQAP